MCLNPHIHEVKKVYQPIKFEIIDQNQISSRITKVLIKNKYDFLNLDHLDFIWMIEEDGKKILNGRLPRLKLKPDESEVFSFNHGNIQISSGSKYFLTIIRQLCNLCDIQYENKIKYSNSKYEPDHYQYHITHNEPLPSILQSDAYTQMNEKLTDWLDERGIPDSYDVWAN